MGRGAKLSKETAPQVESMPGFEGRYQTEDGYIFGFESFAEAGDFTPFYRGLPDDLCQSHHWGYVIKGRMIMHGPRATSSSRPEITNSCLVSPRAESCRSFATSKEVDTCQPWRHPST